MIQHAAPLEGLGSLPIFENMTDEERRELLAIASTREHEPGEIVLAQGKNSRNLLIVLEGRCQVVRKTGSGADGEAVLAEVGPDEHFGEMSFFHAAPHSASVRAVTPVRLLRFARKDYEALLARGSLAAYKLAYNILDDLAARLRRMDDWVTELLSQPHNAEKASEWAKFRDKLFDGWNL